MRDGLAVAPDLTRSEPRGFREELDGYAMLPRTLDKARATLAGIAGRFQFGCPVDHTCMARLGIEPERLFDLAARYADDADVLEGLRRHGIPAAEEAWFDAQAVEDEIQDGPYLRVRSSEQLPERGAERLFLGAEHGAEVDVAIVTAPPGAEEPVHEHPRAEVVAVTRGAATYYLGAWQARIVRRGEIVRIPAGVPHGYAVFGDAQFEAVSVR